MDQHDMSKVVTISSPHKRAHDSKQLLTHMLSLLKMHMKMISMITGVTGDTAIMAARSKAATEWLKKNHPQIALEMERVYKDAQTPIENPIEALIESLPDEISPDDEEDEKQKRDPAQAFKEFMEGPSKQADPDLLEELLKEIDKKKGDSAEKGE